MSNSPSSALGPSAATEAKITPKQHKTGRTLNVRLKLPSAQLQHFPTTLARKDHPAKSSSDAASEPPAPLPESSSGQDDSEKNATPVPHTKYEAGTLAPPTVVPRRKPGPAPRGIKRSAPGLDANGNPRPRAKPGPKRRPRPDDDPNEESKNPWTTNAASTQKLGPKANQGAINAGLRALDRTGKPCRRWDRKGYELKSFTGVAWLMPQWSTPKLQEHSTGDTQSDATGSGKAENSAAGSASSNNADLDVNGQGVAADAVNSPPVQTPVASAA